MNAPAPVPNTNENAAAALLGVVAALVRESRPGSSVVPAPRLDSSLERELGIDSLARVELLLRIEREFDVRLPDSLLASAETPRDLLRAVLAGTHGKAHALAATPIEQAALVGERFPDAAATLIEALEWHAEAHPDRVHIMVLDDDGHPEPVTYGALRAEARRVAAGLLQRGVGAGAAVAIMLPTSRDFFRAFAGIMMAGAVPVPIYPPARASLLAEHLERQSRILDNCRATLLVTVAQARLVARSMQGTVPSLAGVATVEELLAGEGGAVPGRAAGGDLAFLQYTSGSTGNPKGVMLTHANLLANLRAMGRTIGAGPDDVFVSWLPLYHDMGLIGAWMGGLYFAFPLVVMSPVAFLNRPSRWLQAMHRFRGTISAAPNFAYEILATRVDDRELEGLDLSRWRLAFNGAEPVSPETLERFAERFGRFGFRREALEPVYGLAECALGLAFPPPGRGPRIDRVDRKSLAVSGEARPAGDDDPGALRVVSCGLPLVGHEIRILGPDGAEMHERGEGRIQFRGPSATSGYFRNAEATRALFDGDWLDTGDLGYVAAGEIHITGRAKDLIIRGGRHVHPQELEQAVGSLPGIRKGCVVVFGATDAVSGSERVILLAETRLPAGAEQEALREKVAQVALAVLGAPADDIVLAPPHTVPKTSSGKLRRSASRDIYVRGAIGRAGRPAWLSMAAFAAAVVAARARGFARTIRRWLYGAGVLAMALPLALAGLAILLVPQAHARWRALRSLLRFAIRASGLRLAAQGLENVPADGPAVLVANHASYVDGPILTALLPRRARYAAKKEFVANPLMRFILGRVGVAWVERHDVERGVEDARAMAGHVRQGELLVVFPEGTFTRAPGLGPFRMGAFVAAAQADAPVVPLAIRGTRSVLRAEHWLPRRGAVGVSVGTALAAPGREWRDAVRLRDEARAHILRHCGEPDLAEGER